jgi:gluconolactonase
MIAKKLAVVLIVATLMGVCKATDAGVTAPGAEVRKLAGDFQFTEGPAADAQGNVYFSDIPNNRILKWSGQDSKLSTFLENSGGANGLYFDKDGSLLACLGGARRLVSISPKGEVTVLADMYEGKKFNSPNDLWIDPKGGVYFSDPRYGNREGMEQKGEYVYYLTPDRKQGDPGRQRHGPAERPDRHAQRPETLCRRSRRGQDLRLPNQRGRDTVRQEAFRPGRS